MQKQLAERFYCVYYKNKITNSKMKIEDFYIGGVYEYFGRLVQIMPSDFAEWKNENKIGDLMPVVCTREHLELMGFENGYLWIDDKRKVDVCISHEETYEFWFYQDADYFNNDVSACLYSSDDRGPLHIHTVQQFVKLLSGKELDVSKLIS